MCANISHSYEWGHNYALIGQNADVLLLMTYEWGYTYGPPMAVAPIGAVRRVVEFALTQMDAAKILLGFPNYAYDWTLPFTAGATRAQSIGNEAAPLLAAQYGAVAPASVTSPRPGKYA